MIRQSGHVGRLTFLTVFVFLFVVLWIRPLEAQEPSISRDKAVLRGDSQGANHQSSSLKLTEVQKKSLEELRSMYAKEAIPMKTTLLALRIELRHSLRDPNVQPQTLLGQQKKISALRARLEELSLSYQVKARSIFTKEQLERLPQGWAFDLGLANETPGMDRFYRRK